MAAIEETAYPQLKLPLSRKVLQNSFTPTVEEIQFAQKHCREPWAQICLLTLLKAFQHLGYFLMWSQIPGSIVNTVSQSLGYLFLPDEVSADYDQSGNKYRHMRLVRKYLKVKSIGVETYTCMRQAAWEAAQTKEYLADIINVMIEELVRQRFELPAFSRFTREAGSVRQAVNQQTCERVSQTLSEKQKSLIDHWLSEQSEQGQSWWQQLKKEPPAPTVRNTKRYVEHVEHLKEYYQLLKVSVDLPEAKRKQFYYEAYAADLTHLRNFLPDKRYCFVVILLERQMSKALDAIAQMFIRRMRKLHRSSEELLEQYHQENRQQILRLIGYLAQITTAFQTPGTPVERFEAIVNVMPAQPDIITQQCYQHLAYAEDNYRLCMLPIYKGKRQYYLIVSQLWNYTLPLRMNL